MRYLLQLCSLTAVLCAQGSDVVISQIYGGGGNSAAPLRNDFVELFNRGRTPVDLTGWSVQYTSASGTSWQVTPLSGTIASGHYFLIQQAAGANTGLPALPEPDVSGAIAMSAGGGKVALSRTAMALTGSRPADTVDLVGYGDANGFEGSAPARAPANATAVVRRGGGCADTDDNFNDFLVAEPSPRNSRIALARSCSQAPPDPVQLRISEIQGTGARSPVEGQFVSTSGIVTGRSRNGFWIQSLPVDDDADPATSEGLFVFLNAAPPETVSRGAIVRVTGTVSEYRPASDPESLTLTEIVEAAVAVTSQGQTVPAAIELTAVTDWERYEGMRVRAPVLRTVSPTLAALNETTNSATSTGVFFGVLKGTVRPYRVLGRSLVLRVDTRAQGGQALDVTSGVEIRKVIGPLDYVFRTFTVAQDDDAPMEVGPLRGITVVPDPLRGEIVAASMNLQRLFDTKDDPGTSDPVVTDAILGARVEKTARVIRGVLKTPDIIAVQEAENADVLRLVASAAGAYDAHLLEGNDIGGIDVGLLTKRGRVQVYRLAQEGRDIRYGNGFLWDRPPLVAQMTIEGGAITVVAVHLRSLLDAEDPTVAGKRQAQAEYLRDIVRVRTAAGEHVMVLGDFNMFQDDPLMAVIRSGGPLVNLTDTLPPHENYSYIQDGVAQTLDHILLSEGLRSRLHRTQYVRINADFPAAWRGDLARVERYSDHDIPVAWLSDIDFVHLAAAGVTNAATFLSGSIAPGAIVSIFGRWRVQPEPWVFFNEHLVRAFYGDANQVNVQVPSDLDPGSEVLIRVESGGHITNTVRVPVSAAAPGIFAIRGSPAEPGGIIEIWATGAPPEALRAQIGGKPAEILYSGPAPGMRDGVLQVNARVPAHLPPGPADVILSAGDAVSAPGVDITVR